MWAINEGRGAARERDRYLMGEKALPSGECDSQKPNVDIQDLTPTFPPARIVSPSVCIRMENTAQRVIGLIREAFSGVHCPKVQDLLRDSNVDPLWAEAFLNETETDWLQIDPTKIEKECSALTVLSPSAFRFYLPAYMLWDLNNFQTSKSNTVDHVIYDLDLTGRKPKSRQLMENQFRVLSKHQSKAVLAFLEFMSQKSLDEFVDTSVARRAIDSYWHRFQG